MYPKRSMMIASCAECDHKSKSVFCHLSQQELEDLSLNKVTNIYRKGQIIFYQGNQPFGLYCIYKGKVKIHKLGDEGKEQIVRFAGENDVLGYRSLLSGEPYSASATALEETHICHISQSQFFNILKTNNDLLLKMIRLLTKDLKYSEQKMMNMAQKPVRERIAESLLLLKENFGLDEQNVIQASLTRREISDIAGTTIETTIRVLSEFNKEGLISLKNKKIIISDMPKLVRTAQIYD